MSVNEREREPFKYEILEHICVLGKGRTEGFKKEFNYVSFNGAEAKWDLREWNDDHTKMSKGMALTSAEMKDIVEAMEGRDLGPKG